MLSEAKKAKKKGGKDLSHGIICVMMKLSKAILKHQHSSKKKAKVKNPKGIEPVSQLESTNDDDDDATKRNKRGRARMRARAAERRALDRKHQEEIRQMALLNAHTEPQYKNAYVQKLMETAESSCGEQSEADKSYKRAEAKLLGPGSRRGSRAGRNPDVIGPDDITSPRGRLAPHGGRRGSTPLTQAEQRVKDVEDLERREVKKKNK